MEMTYKLDFISETEMLIELYNSLGINRSTIDFSIAVIGKLLIFLTNEKIGELTMLLLLSFPSAMNYYPKVDFQKVENSFIIKGVK